MTRPATGWNAWRMGLLALVHCAGTGAGAQGFLTVGEVYDFEVGDVFHRVYSATGPDELVVDTVIGVHWTAGLDSVRYVIDHWYYQPATGPGLPITLTHWIDSLWYTDLSAPAEHFPFLNWCPVLEDTMGSAGDLYTLFDVNCGREVWRRQVSQDSCSGWGPSMLAWESVLFRGCGGPFTQSFDLWTNATETYRLSYFHKGQDECGTPLTIPLGLGDKEISPRVAIATSLFTDVVEFSVTEGGGCEAVCFDGKGRAVLRDRLREGKAFLNTSTWAAGPYSFVCSMDDGTAVLRGVKVQ